MIQKLCSKWFASDDCKINNLISYMSATGDLRDAQIEAIKTYLFLKIACDNKPLYELFCNGTFNTLTENDLNSMELSANTREVLLNNKSALALYEYATQKNEKGEDCAEFDLNEVQEELLPEYKITINSFMNDRVLRHIDAYNQKGELNSKYKKFKPITISEEGLELIEWLSVDCTASDGEWHSDSEIKIDKLGFVIKNGIKTKDFWDGAIKSEKKPLRLKIRNICGDETEWKVE